MLVKQFLIALTVGCSGGAWGWVVVPSNTNQALYGMERNGRLIVGAGGSILKDVAVYVNKSSAAASSQANYQPESSGTAHDLYAVDCINSCWVVGDSGTVLHQGSGPWTRRSLGTDKALRSIHFISDTSYGYVAGDSGTILRKNGAAWEKLSSGVSQNLRAIQFQYNYLSGSDTNRYDTGFAVGAGGTILKTTNRGSTWQTLTSGTSQALHAVYFAQNSATGFAVGAGGTILKTVNRGGAWTAIGSGTTYALYGIHFYGPQHTGSQPGIIVGQSGVMLMTSDGGNTWSSVNTGTAKNLHSVFLSGAMQGIAVGADGTIVATNSSTAINGQKVKMESKRPVRLIWSESEGLRLHDVQGRFYDIHGKRLPELKRLQP